MKKIIFGMTGLLAALVASGQQRNDEWGVKAGVNFAYQVTTDAHTNMRTSGHFGVLREFDIHTFFAVQTELLFSMQGAKDSRFIDKFNYLTVPIVGKFYVYPRKFSGDMGVYAGYLLSAKSHQRHGDTEDVREHLKKWDGGLSIGLSYRVTRHIEASVRFSAGFVKLGGDSDYRNGVIQAGANYRF